MKLQIQIVLFFITLLTCNGIHTASFSGQIYTSTQMPKPLKIIPGSVDLSFSNFGFVEYNIDGTTLNSANDIAIDRFGRIVVAGESTSGAEARFTLLRLTTTGDLDLSFGSSGYVVTDIVTTNTLSNYANAIAIDSQNRILAAGVYNLDPAIVRYTEDGVLDTTFGAGGVTTTSIANNNFIEDIAIDSQGRIVAVGYSTSNANDVLVLRYDKDGGLDSTFGTSSGYTILSGLGTAETTYALTIDSSDNIILAGAKSGNVLVARLTSEGLLDLSFGTSGYVSISTANPVETLYSVKIDSQGRILAGGVVNDTTTTPHAYGFFVVRLLATGELDTSFNGVGYGRYGFSGFTTTDKGMAIIDPLGRIVLMGSMVQTGSGAYRFLVARILSDGQTDLTFGVVSDVPGMNYNSALPTDAYMQSCVLDHQGRPVLAGYMADSFCFARFTSDYSLEYYRKQFATASLGFLG